MTEIPAHLIEHLHYELDGRISGDTDEAKAWVEKMGWNGERVLFERNLVFFSFRKTIQDELKRITPLLRFKNKIQSAILDFCNTYLIYSQGLNTASDLLFPLKEQPINIVVIKTILNKKTQKGDNLEQATIKTILAYLQNTNIEITAFFLNLIPEETANGLIELVSFSTITSAHTKNYYCIENLALDNLKSREIYFLGRNGDGKTLILQSLIFALKHPYIQEIGDKKRLGTLLQYWAENPTMDIAVGTEAGIEIGTKFRYSVENVFAYGVNRSNETSDTDSEAFDQEGFLTLFENDKKLLSPDKWLLDVRMRELEAKEKGETPLFTTQEAKTLLEDLLNDKEEGRTVEILVDAANIRVHYTERNGTPIRFHQLSAGYQSVLIWVADLVARLSKNQPDVRKLEDFQGIVLVDEVGLHLHPKWEYNLMRKLRGWFPKIQFIVTTHSPVLLMGASEDALIYKIYKEDGKTKLAGSLSQEQLRKMMIHQIITSPLFGLDTMAPRLFDPQQANNDEFLYGRIHEVVSQRLREHPTLDDAAIDQWIAEELDNIINEKP